MTKLAAAPLGAGFGFIISMQLRLPNVGFCGAFFIGMFAAWDEWERRR